VGYFVGFAAVSVGVPVELSVEVPVEDFVVGSFEGLAAVSADPSAEEFAGGSVEGRA
jgi:hypothetical protein